MREAVDLSAICYPEGATVREVLREAIVFLSRAGVESARIDAEVLLCSALQASREEIYLDFDRPLGAESRKLVRELLQRRARREPVAYIIGKKEFWSLDFLVSRNVLVPRPETELLVELALKLATEVKGTDLVRILDLGTGSGAIAVSLARELKDAEIWASDISSGALKIARVNASRHGVEERIRFVHGDAFEPVQSQGAFFDLVLSNPPYVRRSEIQDLPPEVREWEPRQALDGGEDGLESIRRIVQEGHLYAADGAFVALEIGADLARGVAALFAGVGSYSEISIHRDLAGKDRVVAARKLLGVDRGKGRS